MSEWRDISTAPKDGTQFLAILSNGWYALVRSPRPYNPKERYQWWWTGGTPCLPIVETHPADTDWEGSYTLTIKYWQPLPAPPED